MIRKRSVSRVFAWHLLVSAVIAVGPFASRSASATEGIIQRSGLTEEVLNDVSTVYRFVGVSQTEAEALFGSAIAAIYYPGRGEVRLLADDQLQTANQWLDLKAGQGSAGSSGKSYPSGSALRSKLKATARMSLRGFLEPDATLAGSGIEITDEPYIAKVPGLYTARDLPPATTGLKRMSADSTNKDYFYYYDDFEQGVWDRWSRSDNTSGQYTWGVRSCDSYSGSYSADAARGGSLGALLGCESPHPNSTEMYMYIEQCQTILPAWKAFLELQLTASIDSEGDDYFSVSVGPSFSEAWGWDFFGTWSGWYTLVFNLRQWYELGDLGENYCNTLVLGFESDSTGGSGYGARVDDVYIFYGDTVGSLECGIFADPESGSSPLTVAFRSTTDMYSPGFDWSFGDGFTSDERDPVHVFSNAGDYQVSLWTWDDYGTECTASIEIAVSQGSCTYSISPSSRSLPATGGNGSISVTAPSECSWSANTPQSWIHITGGSTGSGNGTVSYSVDTNSATSQRSGTVTVAGKTFSITQDGAPGGGCVPNLAGGVVCLRNGRFEFTGTWTDFANPPVTLPLIWTPVENINATAGFQNNPSGIQIVMRVADGCSLTGTWWVWLGGFTDAGWDIRVRDTVTGKQRTFTKSRQGGVFPTTLRDSTTFTCN